MPRGLHNWTLKDIVDFLKEHGFHQTHVRGSHFYYLGSYAGQPEMAVQRTAPAETLRVRPIRRFCEY